MQCQRAATGAAKFENGANKANRQPKVRPYATMIFGSISADVRAKTKAILCVLLMLTVLGWPLASFWAVMVVHTHLADKRTERVVRAIKYHR